MEKIICTRRGEDPRDQHGTRGREQPPHWLGYPYFFFFRNLLVVLPFSSFFQALVAMGCGRKELACRWFCRKRFEDLKKNLSLMLEFTDNEKWKVILHNTSKVISEIYMVSESWLVLILRLHLPWSWLMWKPPPHYATIIVPPFFFCLFCSLLT